MALAIASIMRQALYVVIVKSSVIIFAETVRNEEFPVDACCVRIGRSEGNINNNLLLPPDRTHFDPTSHTPVARDTTLRFGYLLLLCPRPRTPWSLDFSSKQTVNGKGVSVNE